MSITNDIRSYADSAREQLSDVTGQANEFVGKLTDTARGNVSDLSSKATDAVHDLRTQAEKAINLDAVKSAIEPYVAQAKGYTTSVSDRAEGVYDSIRKDKRVAQVLDRVESLTGAVVETVQEHLVKPLQQRTGLGAKPVRKPASKTTAKPASKTTAKPAATTAKPSVKAPVKKAPAKSSTAKKTTPRRSPKA
jgi:uncharacterized protein YjbJ (UPF0337 family)